MPTPLEILLDPISLIILAMYAFLMIWESVAPGRELPKIKYWKIRGISVFIVYFYVASYLPLLWDNYFAQYQIFDLTSLGTLGGAAIGIFVYQFGIYVWHRAMHKNNFLWKTFHQMHHSAERLDTYSAFYFSPMDMFGFTLLGSICLTLIVGLSPQAATVTILFLNFLGMFQHTNVKTPTWLGYIIQRPESHTIHHAKEIHAYNYSDLPIFDIIFGTFRNPKQYENETGFYIGASKRIIDMIMMKDIEKKISDNQKEVEMKSFVKQGQKHEII